MMNERVVHAKLHQLVPQIALCAVSRASRQCHHTLMLGAEGDQCAHRRVVAALDVGAKELAALGDANGIEAIFKDIDILQKQAYFINLLDETEKSACD